MQWVAAQKSSGTNRRKDVRKTLPKTGSQNTVFRSDKAGSKVIRETVVFGKCLLIKSAKSTCYTANRIRLGF